MGNPIVVTNANVVLETSSGVRIQSVVAANLAPGLNYRLRVPMDAGLTADTYKPTALRPTVPFRMKVRIGQTTYLPIEMTGRFANLGEPARETRLDLTLGEDADGDGLPDPWERSLISALGLDCSLTEVRPEDDADKDGLANLQEYLAGTYAFDPQDGFKLAIAGYNNGNALLEFLAITGRSYSISASADLDAWSPVQFRLAPESPDAPPRTTYQATDVRLLRVEVLGLAPEPSRQLFFKATVK
jgi:hypothetical protein